jgi:exosortase H (IPTLxxWG-CTERM-specific)
MTRFVVLFVVILCSLFGFYLLPWGQDYMATPVTTAVAKVCVTIMQLFDSKIVSEGIVIRDNISGHAISVVAGCNGMEAVIILFAALFAFPATFTQKCAGFVVGFFAIHALNVVRISSLFYMNKYSHTMFEWFHLYVWQMLIILDALVVWLLWLRWINKARRTAGAAAASA